MGSLDVGKFGMWHKGVGGLVDPIGRLCFVLRGSVCDVSVKLFV